jgi:hypothetical protein
LQYTPEIKDVEIPSSAKTEGGNHLPPPPIQLEWGLDTLAGRLIQVFHTSIRLDAIFFAYGYQGL